VKSGIWHRFYISETRADRENLLPFLESAGQIYPEMSLTFEAPKSVLPSVICFTPQPWGNRQTPNKHNLREVFRMLKTPVSSSSVYSHCHNYIFSKRLTVTYPQFLKLCESDLFSWDTFDCE
jgi:hypothetical protein